MNALSINSLAKGMKKHLSNIVSRVSHVSFPAVVWYSCCSGLVRTTLGHGVILSFQYGSVSLPVPQPYGSQGPPGQAYSSPWPPTKAFSAPQAYVNMSLFENFTYAGIDATAEEAWATVQPDPGSAGQSTLGSPTCDCWSLSPELPQGIGF